jgi:tripartite-type tricarboxylate transporter receptor subunit TctC
MKSSWDWRSDPASAVPSAPFLARRSFQYDRRVPAPLKAALAAGALAFAGVAAAQPLMHLVVPFAAGGVQDIVARSLNAELGTLLGRNVIVENRAGAGGTIGTGYVAKAAPDGNTLVLAAASHTIAGSLYARLPYRPLEDFSAVAHIGSVDYVLMASAKVPARSVAEFVAYGKANPGKLNYATAGNGSATHLSMAYFASLAGLDMVHIPFKSTGEAVQEVLAGRAQAVIAANIGALPYVSDARVRMLGSTGAKRSKFLPDLPTIAESAPEGRLRDYRFDSWLGLLGPAGMSAATVAQINDAMAKLLRDPVILGRLAKQGVEPRAMSAAQFSALLKADYARNAEIVKASGAKID